MAIRRMHWAHLLGFALVVVPLMGWVIRQETNPCSPTRWEQCR